MFDLNRLTTQSAVFSIFRLGTLSRSLFLIAMIFMAGCESKWEKMPDDELAMKSAECYNMNDPAPAMIQVCKNYKRECERRRDNGVYIC